MSGNYCVHMSCHVWYPNIFVTKEPLQNFRTLQQPLLGEKQIGGGKERERKMPSIMATSLAQWRTHSDQTKMKPSWSHGFNASNQIVQLCSIHQNLKIGIDYSLLHWNRWFKLSFCLGHFLWKMPRHWITKFLLLLLLLLFPTFVKIRLNCPTRLNLTKVD